MVYFTIINGHIIIIIINISTALNKFNAPHKHILHQITACHNMISCYRAAILIKINAWYGWML